MQQSVEFIESYFEFEDVEIHTKVLEGSMVFDVKGISVDDALDRYCL